jgi:peptidoglycan/LPS O-acetylase OafA/YrhL
MICQDDIVAEKQPTSERMPTTEHDRVYELDLLRFIAAFSVLMFHYSFRGAAGKPGNTFTAFNYAPMAGVARYGYLGVNLFFLISGFVILMSANGSSPRRFLISRFVRLYPAYWVCCSITFLAAFLQADPRFPYSIQAYLENMTMMNGFVGRPPLFVDGSYWSLAVELKFYFLVFVVLVIRQFNHLKLFLALWLVGAGICHFYREKFSYFLLMPQYAGYFIAGAAFYIAYLEGWSFFTIMLLLGAYPLVIHCAIEDAQLHLEDYGPPFEPWVVAFCISLFFALFFLITTRRLRRFCSPRLLFLATLTYPLYLLHQNIGYLIFNQLNDRVNHHLLFWGVTGAMMVAAGLVHVFIERRYARRLKRFLERVLPQ